MSKTAIRIKNLTKDFSIGLRGVRLRAVDDLSLDIRDNQVFGLLGPNGCGKSTTMKIILGLLDPSKGECSIYDVPSHRVASRREVGFLPEAPYFQKYLTGRELVHFHGRLCGLSGEAVKKRAEYCLELVGLEGAAHRRVGTYSKGMLQRLGLAQAIVHDPKLLILDEPTAGVDPVGSSEIADIIVELKKRGKTVLLCSHLLAQVEGVCDEVAIMNRGRLVVQGAVNDLLTVSGQTSLTFEGLAEGDVKALQAFAEERGAKAVGQSTPRMPLVELYLGRIGDSEKETKEPS